MNLKPYFLSLTLLFVSGCSQRFQDVNATMSAALFGADDIELSKEKIQQLPYASAYARINDGAQIFVVLAFAEVNPNSGYMQYKWMSSDRALIVTENGRIVKTVGWEDHNLNGVRYQPQTASSWNVTYDWMPNYQYGYSGVLITTPMGTERLDTAYKSYVVDKYQETIVFNAIDAKLVNTYWKDTKSGKVIKSIEQLGPDMKTIELTILKPPAM